MVSVSLIKDEPIILVSKNGYIIKFKSNEITATGRLTSGVKGMALAAEDELIFGLPVRHEEDDIAVFSSKGYGKKVSQKELTIQKRAGKGVIIYKPNESYGYITCGQLVSDEDSVLLIGNKNSVCVAATEIPETGRPAYGNIMLKNNNIISVSKI